VSEGISDNLLDKPREQQVKEHYIAPGIVEAELREAGFEIVDRDDAFTRFTGRTIVGGYWLIRARRPSGPYEPSLPASMMCPHVARWPADSGNARNSARANPAFRRAIDNSCLL